MGDSMSSVVISGDSSGAITLAAPSVAGTNTITLPASTGTVLTTGSPQSGGVIQVVQAGSSGGSTNSSSLVDMGLSATITPKFSTSKILVYINGVYRLSTSMRAGFAIIRGSTNIVGLNELIAISNATSATNNSYFLNVLDSPATTSPTTYKVQFVSNGSGTIYTNDGGTLYAGNLNYITLMEIAA
jgi:hypothetical protein